MKNSFIYDLEQEDFIEFMNDFISEQEDKINKYMDEKLNICASGKSDLYAAGIEIDDMKNIINDLYNIYVKYDRAQFEKHVNQINKEYAFMNYLSKNNMDSHADIKISQKYCSYLSYAHRFYLYLKKFSK